MIYKNTSAPSSRGLLVRRSHGEARTAESGYNLSSLRKRGSSIYNAFLDPAIKSRDDSKYRKNNREKWFFRPILLIFISLFCINIYAFPAQFHPNALQTQAMQTQEFQATKRKAFDAVMTVFQDKGYMIQDSDYNTGYITARRAEAQGVSVTATITSSKKGKDTFSKVRLSYVTPRSQVYDPSFYQQVFNDIRQQLFVGDAMP